MEVSPSTVTLLKLWFTAAESALCKSGAGTGASAVMTEIMVAMFGMIMPEPFAMPPTVKVQPA